MEISSQKASERVNAPPRFALIRAGKREGRVTVTEAERSVFPPKRLVRQLVFTEFGWSRVTTSPPASLKDEVSPVKLSRKLYLPRPSLIALPKSESPIPVLQDDVKSKSGTPTPEGSKQCRCKKSKCLKLYCECFAVGAYCNGCNCSRCHNKVENEDLRKAAAEIIQERNPRAFRPKIATSPLYSADNAGSTPLAGRHNRGCNCKRTECLKKYCECFRANIFCCENCKCTNCKNSEGHKKEITKMITNIYMSSLACEERIDTSERNNDNLKICQNFEECEERATSPGQHGSNIKLYNQLINSVISDGLGLSGHVFSKEQVSRKRKVKELPSVEEHISNQRLAEYQKMSTVGVSRPLSDSVEDPMVPNNSSASLRHPYRPLLAGPIHPDSSRKLCSGLLMLAEAANVLAGELIEGIDDQKNLIWKNEYWISYFVLFNSSTRADVIYTNFGSCDSKYARTTISVKVSKLDMKDAVVTKQANLIDAQNKENYHVICDESGTAFMEAASVCEILRHDWDNVLAEQEKRVLTSFKGCLEKLISAFADNNAGAEAGDQFCWPAIQLFDV